MTMTGRGLLEDETRSVGLTVVSRTQAVKAVRTLLW